MATESSSTATPSQGGLFVSIKNLAGSLIGIAHTRIELFATEFEEERLRIETMLVWSMIAVFCGGLGILLVTLFVVVALWDTHRLLALGIAAMLYLAAAGLAWRYVLGTIRMKPRFFGASLAALSRDREQLLSRK